MSHVAIEKVHGKGEPPASFLEDLRNLAERIRHRAFEIFEHRGSADGSDLDDWLQAEREMTWAPESELKESGGRFELEIAVPGFEEKDLNVTALQDAVVVRAEASHSYEKTEHGVHRTEYGERSLLRRFDLPGPIDVDKVSANLDHGVLKLSAPKAVAGQASASAVSRS